MTTYRIELTSDDEGDSASPLEAVQRVIAFAPRFTYRVTDDEGRRWLVDADAGTVEPEDAAATDAPTYIISVLYRVAGDDPTAAWERFAHALRHDDRAVFCGSPLADTGCETFDVDVSDADERLRRLAPAEEFETHDLRHKLGRFEQAALDLAVRAGSMPEGSGSFIPYTVVGLYADNDQRFATTVQAFDPLDAERRAREEADGELTIAAVFVGELPVADAG